MSLDPSLKTSGALEQHRSVLTRQERVAKLQATKNFDPKKSPVLGLQKTVNRRVGR
jgi:small basic protein (TIGR04137 family)